MKGLIILSLLAGLQTDPEQAGYPPPDPFTQIITAEMIRHAGLVRPGEIFLLIDGWDYSTIDGLHEISRAAGLSPLGTNGWILWIDGQRIDMNLLDERSLNLLPLPLQDISYVEVRDVPQVHEGDFARRGIIHIHTVREEDGRSARCGLWAGNETGDAGPYRYLEGSTADIEHNGPELSASYGSGTGKRWYRLSAVTRNQPVTDVAVYRRNLNLSYEMPVVEMLAAGLSMNLETGRGYHVLSAGISNIEDFLFHRLLGREVPADTRFRWIGANGALPSKVRGQLLYRVSYTSNNITDWPNKLDFDFDSRLDFLRGSLELQEQKGDLLTGFGISWEQVEARHRELPVGGYEMSLRRFFGRTLLYGYCRGIGSGRLRQDLDLYADITKEDVAFGGSARALLPVDGRNVLAGSLSFTERRPEDDHGYWYRQLNRNLLHSDNIFHYVTAGELTNSRMLTADLMWRSTPAVNLKTEVRTYFRYFHDLALESNDLAWDQVNGAYINSPHLESWNSGSVSGAILSARYYPTAKLVCRLRFDVRLGVTGSDLFAEKWESIPSHQVRGSLTYIPVPAFSLTAIASFRAETTWSGYAEARGIWEGLSFGKVRGGWNVDIIAGKWFWNNRLRGTILARNLFNRHYRYHPVGAAFDLSLLARFELYIGN